MEKVKGWLAITAVLMMGYLPLALSRWIGMLIGRYNVWCGSRLARVTEENLRLCLPELDATGRRLLVKRSLIETGKTVAEVGAVWLRPYSWLRKKIQAVVRQDLLETKIAAGKGVIILIPHLGNWEVVGLYLSELTQVTSLYQPSNLIVLEHLIRRAREKAGARLVPTNRRGVMALLKTLRKGGVTAILPDQVPDQGGGTFAPFFGQAALTMTLVHNLVGRTGCNLVFCYAKRVQRGFEIYYREADAETLSHQQQVALAAMNKGVEQCVRAIPEQYQWEYKRFKRRPKGEDKLYQYK